MSLVTIWTLVRRVPGLAWAGLAALLLLAGLVHWHDRAVAAAFAEGVREQAATDRAAVLAANAAARQAAAARNAALGRTQATISRESEDGLQKTLAAVVRRRDDLRLRWATARAAAAGDGTPGPAALPGAAAVALDTACPAAGWVAFDTAAAAAAAADEAIAKDDAWIAWVREQAVAWPKP